ncbi:MAG: hypothetical protein ACOCX9_04130 [Spirochaetota bacterium]
MDALRIRDLTRRLLDVVTDKSLEEEEKKMLRAFMIRLVSRKPVQIPEEAESVIREMEEEFANGKGEMVDELLIGELLKREGLATADDIDKAVRKQERLRKNNQHRLLAQILEDMNVITTEQLNSFIYRYYFKGDTK